jgi:cathepsin L
MSAFKVVALIISVALAVITYQQVVSKVIHPNTDSNVNDLWSAWKAKYGKSYSAVEEAQRASIFANNYAKVQAHNADPQFTYTLGMNKFADLTPTEFKTTYASCAGGIGGGLNDEYCPSAENCPTLPAHTFTTQNWTASGAVTGVKNQEQCGSCWAFSTTGSLEGLYYLNHSVLLSFSEQQLVDCAKNCEGCNGCWPYLAMEYTAQNGIELEKVYPYKGVQGQCKYQKSLAMSANTGYQCVAQKNQDQLLAALQSQPDSISVEADQNAWQLYSSGVVNTQCGAALDHAVLLTGYGNYQGQSTPSYYVKNSWGSDWGMEGYIWIGTSTTANTGYGVCGILRCPTLPINS